MSILWSVIKEEQDRLEELIPFYVKKINKFPKGYLSKKKRNERVYIYLNYRKDKTVLSKYIGTAESKAVQNLTKQLTERKKYEEYLNEVKHKLKEVKHALGKRK